MPGSKAKRPRATAQASTPQAVVDARGVDEEACNIYLGAIISDCERSLKESNMLALCRMHYVLKELQLRDGRLWHALQATNPKLSGKIEKKIEEWKLTLKPGDKVDVFVEIEKKWHSSTVRDVKKDEVGLSVEVKYKGWDDSYNEFFYVHQKELAFHETWTRRGAKSFIEEGFLLKDDSDEPVKEVLEEKVWVPGHGYVLASEADKFKKTRTDRGTREAAAREAATAVKSEEPVAAKGRSSKKRLFTDPATGEAVEEDDNDWFCSECGLMESRDGSDLLLCDGPCLRSWHQGCLSGLNLKKIRSQGNEEWRCHDCTVGEHACMYCKERGTDNTHGGVWKCKLKECGKYAHEKCLETGDFLRVKVKKEVACVPVDRRPPSSPGGGPFVNATSALSFTCPRHLCDTCYPFYGSTKSAGIVSCLHCPRGYHDQCMLPGSRFNEIYLICPSHPHEVLPSLDKIGRSDNVDYSSPESQMFERMILPSSSALPSVNDHAASGHFRLPIQYKEDISSGEPTFKKIRRLDYDALPSKVDSLPFHPPEECCSCRGRCGRDCLNRVSKVECCEPVNGELVCRACEPAEGGGEGRNKSNCGNRCFQNFEYAKMERFREHAMGWGMRAAEDIAEGSLVVEYVGEVIDEETMRTRMLNQRKYSPSDHDFYIMEIDNGFYVDGKHKGNESRFINHSCDPNCELERYNVKGRMRIGIFAIKSIKRGEALSYDYQFDTMEAEIFKCYCGSDSCRGTMAPKKKGDKGSLSNAERRRLAALGRAKERKANKGKDGSMSREAELRRSYTGRFLPGDSVHRVAEGPPRSAFPFGRQARLFLPRSSRRSAHFKVRERALKRQKA